VFDCGEERGHDDDLLPFYHSNPELLEIYKIISSDEEPPQRKARVLIYLNCVNLVEAGGNLRCNNDRRFHTDDNCYIYSEDTWTKRLFEAVVSRYQNDDIDYTAPFQGPSCTQAVLKRNPKGTPKAFHSSPDIIIKHKPVMIQDDIKFSCIETKKSISKPYLSTSMIPQQAGQIICYIHQLLVAEIINKCVVGQVANGATGYGLYIIRESGTCILLKVSLTEKPLSISAKVLYRVDFVSSK